jgi:hypothetical protein
MEDSANVERVCQSGQALHCHPSQPSWGIVTAIPHRTLGKWGRRMETPPLPSMAVKAEPDCWEMLLEEI